MLLFQNGYLGNNKNVTVVSDVSDYSSVKFYIRIRSSTDGNIRDCLLNCAFLTSHNLLFFSLCKTSKKTTFSVLLSFFLVKLCKSRSLKLNISRTAWRILMILVSFCRILDGLSDGINLFWLCSSSLTEFTLRKITWCYFLHRLRIDMMLFFSFSYV